MLCFFYGIKTDILPVIQVFKFPVFNTITFVKGLKAYVENWVENYKTRICSHAALRQLPYYYLYLLTTYKGLIIWKCIY